MNLAKILLVALIPLLFNGCSTLKNLKISDDFDDSSKGYLKMVRWLEFDNAMATYVSTSMREEYQAKIKAVGEARIVDFRVKREECDPVRGEATVTVEFDYYRPPSVTVKTVVDNQKWSYEHRGEQSFWRLKTLLPDFK